MKLHGHAEITIFIVATLLRVMSTEALAQEGPAEPPHSVVFWDGVNSCNPSPNSGHDYIWQENADNLRSSIESYPGEFAQPFGIMARRHEAPQKVAADFEAYLLDCRDHGKVPFVVLSPDLNIEDYMATLNFAKINPFTLPAKANVQAEATVQADIRWTRSITPIILSKLAERGYVTDGYAHSWGGTMVVEGIQAGHSQLRSLTSMNARVPSGSLERLQEKGLVKRLWRLTTAGDAPTYPGKAAFGKGDIFIKHADIQGWDDLNPISRTSVHHNVVLSPGSTPITVEINGKTIRTDLRTILGHMIHDAIPRSNESGVSMKMNVNEESFQKDETGVLDALKSNALDKRPQVDSLSWPAQEKEQQK